MANTQINITSNGTKTLATAGKYCDRNIDVNVAVPASGITPSGTKTITTNGNHDVTNYATAQVNVPVGITPSGSKTITENGTHDVTNYASAVVNVPTGGGSDNYHILPITLSKVGGTAAVLTTLVSGNAFVKANYSKDGFFAMLVPLNATDAVRAANEYTFVYHGNRAIANSKSVVYGIYLKNNSSSSNATGAVNTTKTSANGYVVSLRSNSSGNVILYTAANMYVPAGNYLLVLGLAE